MKPSIVTVRDTTRDAIRKAFYRLGILDTHKQYAYAESLGFDLSPIEGGTTLPSFVNLTEAEGQRLVILLNEAADHSDA